MWLGTDNSKYDDLLADVRELYKIVAASLKTLKQEE